MKTVIIGGGASGASCATRLRRLDEKAEIILLEKTGDVSIANCGLPYYISGVIANRSVIHVMTPQRFKAMFNVDVRLNSEVVRIDRAGKTVTLKDGQSISYDKLVIATGARPNIPSIPGLTEETTFVLRNLVDADKIKSYIEANQCKTALVVGAGFIGLEMTENLVKSGIKTTLLNNDKQVLNFIDKEAAAHVHNELRAKGVNLALGDTVSRINGKTVTLSSGKTVDADIVILAAGITPETSAMNGSGLSVNKGISVTEAMLTDDPDIYAAGDAVEVENFVTGQKGLISLAGPANRQGRLIADNISGKKETYKKSQGTSAIQVFDLTVAAVGVTEKALKAAGTKYYKAITYGPHHATYYPGSERVFYQLLFDANGKILGYQAVGKAGADKRVDVVSTIMRLGGTVADMRDSELCYAPQYSSAKDPVNVMGMVACNILDGLYRPAYAEDLKDAFILCVLPPDLYEKGHIDGAVSIPMGQIRGRLAEVPKDKKIVVHCMTGYTSYLACCTLIGNGYTNVHNYMGGWVLHGQLKADGQV